MTVQLIFVPCRADVTVTEADLLESSPVAKLSLSSAWKETSVCLESFQSDSVCSSGRGPAGRNPGSRQTVLKWNYCRSHVWIQLSCSNIIYCIQTFLLPENQKKHDTDSWEWQNHSDQTRQVGESCGLLCRKHWKYMYDIKADSLVDKKREWLLPPIILELKSFKSQEEQQLSDTGLNGAEDFINV